jgi:hypothetical protein
MFFYIFLFLKFKLNFYNKFCKTYSFIRFLSALLLLNEKYNLIICSVVLNLLNIFCFHFLDIFYILIKFFAILFIFNVIFKYFQINFIYI